jgi:hypothetical protein
MLRLYDHRTGELAELRPVPRLRIGVGDDSLHAMVVADLLRRSTSRFSRTISSVIAAEPVWERYNIPTGQDGPADLTVTSSDPGASGPVVLVGPEEARWRSADDGVDPLCARLAMLAVPYRDPVPFIPARYDELWNRLDRWRAEVARWADSPGRPMDRAYAARCEEALAADLDTPTVLDLLDRLAADPDVPPGAKLETFIHLDLLLGLELVRDIGRR